MGTLPWPPDQGHNFATEGYSPSLLLPHPDTPAPEGGPSAGQAPPRGSLGCSGPEEPTDLLGLPKQVTAVQPHAHRVVAQLPQSQGDGQEVGKPAPGGRDQGVGGLRLLC